MVHRFMGMLLALAMAPAIARDLPLQQIRLPPGFGIELYTANVPNARSLDLSPGGTLFVGSRHAGKVYAVRDSNQDGRGDKVYVIAKGLNMPNGVAFHDGALYVAEINRILRFDNIEAHLTKPPKPVVVSTDFPADKHHGWKFIRIGPDGKLYVPIGAPCNVCIEYGYAVITRINLDGSAHEIYAEGVRNSVGFDWHPDTHELWFTDNGRDLLGDDLPPDELNHAPMEGLHFGFPYCHGGEVLDPEFGLGHRCQEYVAPVQKLDAHVASLGMRFYVGKMFPAAYQKQVFIAEHGSWNRSKKTGYRISLVSLKANKAQSYETFAEGWLQGEQAWGRPVDLEHMPDGSLLVSDDKAGVIYRIFYNGDVTPPSRVQPSAIQVSPRTSETDKKDTLPGQQPAAESGNADSGRSEQRGQNNPQQVIEPSLKQQTTAPAKQLTQPVGSDDTPPPELVEQIRTRTSPDTHTEADPFAPVKKQVVNQ